MINKTLIILDWDDTLFPTTWVTKNNIKLNKQYDRNLHLVTFSELDNLLYKLLINFMKCGKVYIVTNAMVKWVLISASVLPNTQKLLKNNIKIISARDIYKKRLPGQIEIWKKIIFRNLALDFFQDKHKIENIISVGDAKYEFNALIDLDDNFKLKKRYLKSIRFMRYPSFDSLIDQLETLNKAIFDICNKLKHMDLKFDNFN